MSIKFSSDSNFLDLLEASRQEILSRTGNGIQEKEQFKRLCSLLINARRKNPEQDFRYILIEEQALLKLCENADVKIIELFENQIFLTNHTVLIDSELQILECYNKTIADNNNARRYFASLTVNKPVIGFLVSPDASLHYFIDGEDYGDGIFYTSDARRGYECLKTIDCLEEVLDDYRKSLQHQDTYLKFFVNKSSLKAFYRIARPAISEEEFLRTNRQLLANKPEELFREDLRNFIKRKMKVVVTREDMLENLDRLDIKIYDEAGRDLYFIEVKWVGKSINAAGDGYGVKYEEKPRINSDAVVQVVEYIDELMKDNQNIKIGYLAVFDARDNDMSDTGQDISEKTVPERIRRFFPRFHKLKDFRVKNINPR